MRSLRYGLPAALAIAGFAFLIIRRDTTGFEMWSMLVGAAISVLLFNVLFRMGASGDRDRQSEHEAREYFAKHGRWPDE
jgi:hypothetical protein